jgi:hypothetical protein
VNRFTLLAAAPVTSDCNAKVFTAGAAFDPSCATAWMYEYKKAKTTSSRLQSILQIMVLPIYAKRKNIIIDLNLTGTY